MPKTRPLSERFKEKYEINFKTGCWEWIASFDKSGYGQIGTTLRNIKSSHVVSYQIHKGPIPAGYDIHHTCNNKFCVNPEHLEAMLKSAHGLLHTPIETHCVNGHEYVDGSYYKRTDGRKSWRQCKLCCLAQYKKNYPRYKFGPIHIAASTG